MPEGSSLQVPRVVFFVFLQQSSPGKTRCLCEPCHRSAQKVRRSLCGLGSKMQVCWGGCVYPRTGFWTLRNCRAFWSSGVVRISWAVNFGQQVASLAVLVQKRLWHQLYLCGNESGATNTQALPQDSVLLLSFRTMPYPDPSAQHRTLVLLFCYCELRSLYDTNADLFEPPGWLTTQAVHGMLSRVCPRAAVGTALQKTGRDQVTRWLIKE